MTKEKELTLKQEKFAQLVASGIKKAEAYRQCYNALDMLPGTLWTEATKLSQNPNVAQRISKLRSEMLEDMYNSVLWSREESIKATKRAMLRAEKKGKNNEVYKAVEILNNMHGFNAPTQVEIKNKDEVDLSNLSDDELQQLAKIKGKVVKKNANPESD